MAIAFAGTHARMRWTREGCPSRWPPCASFDEGCRENSFVVSFAEKWFTKGVGQQVIQVKMRLEQDAHTLAACMIDRNHCLDTELAPAIEPDHARIDAPGRTTRTGATGTAIHREFDDRNQVT